MRERGISTNLQEVKAELGERRQDVLGLLDLLREEIARHAEFAAKDGPDWGHVGDLGSLRESLVEALVQLAQQDINASCGGEAWTAGPGGPAGRLGPQRGDASRPLLQLDECL